MLRALLLCCWLDTAVDLRAVLVLLCISRVHPCSVDPPGWGFGGYGGTWRLTGEPWGVRTQSRGGLHNTRASAAPGPRSLGIPAQGARGTKEISTEALDGTERQVCGMGVAWADCWVRWVVGSSSG